MFPRATYTTLQKSYRTTIEIMQLANKVLEQMEEDLPLVEPVVRHGREPEFYGMQTLDASKVNEIHKAILNRGHRSIALICKTWKESESIFKELEKAGLPVQLLGENSDINGECLLIVPSHLSKGLEFDAVIIAAFDEPFRDHPIDRKLLYVAMTRPMHELHLLSDTLQPLITP